jgi:hypothetical protein
MYIAEGTLDNLLVSQKDRIIGMIDDNRFSDAETCLDMLAQLWVAAGYEYKNVELHARIRQGKERLGFE